MVEKVGSEYWERIWRDSPLPRAVAPEHDTLRNYSYHQFHLFFSRHLQLQDGKRLIEFGCAQSIWLAYFARYFGLAVTGIDYSATACEKATAVLAREGVDGQIVQADFMQPSGSMLGAHDFGFSYGVAEHFADTAECLMSFRRYLKPGGVLITLIPNLAGALGALQKRMNRRIFEIHVPLDAGGLADAHRRAGMQVVESGYIGCSNFGVITLGDDPLPFSGLRRFARRALMGVSAAAWVVDRSVVSLPATRMFSPYVACVARAP